MDFIAFKPISLPATYLEAAVPVDMYTTATWIERYRESGEFKFTAPLSSGIRDVLPLDTLVSHVDTMDLMFVESHLITEEPDKDPVIEITGRSFDAFLDYRIIGMNRNWTSLAGGLPEHSLAYDYSWEQAKKLINDAIGGSDPNFQWEELIPEVLADTYISGSFPVATPSARVVERGRLSDRVRSILALDDLGIKVIRRNPFGILGGNPDYTTLLIHNGIDRSSYVMFSSKNGDIESAEYLWTNKTFANAELVVSRWLETRVTTPDVPSWYDRREVLISAEDIDQNYPDAPADGSGDQISILANLAARGQAELYARRRFMITRADISPQCRYHYRQDYGIGDVVMVQSNYGDVMPMRVVEYTEIEDEDGETGHPTLNILDY